VSTGGEAVEPAGEVDSCLEQADNSASEPTHNNRTLRFIRSPHYCNGTVTTGPDPHWTLPVRVASGVPPALARLAAKAGTAAPAASAELISPFMDWADRNGAVLFGDGDRQHFRLVLGLELLRAPGALGEQNGAARRIEG